MRFLSILTGDMLAKRVQRIADRNALSALVGAMRFAVENHGDEMSEAKRSNLNNVSKFADQVIEDNADLEATLVAVFDSATQHADEVRVLRLENADLKRRVSDLEEALEFTKD